MVANLPSCEVKAGFMGKPVPGICAAIVKKTGDGGVQVLDEPGEEGELALRTGWPSMFRGYFGEPERYEKCFLGDWYITGDLACCENDGYYRYVGREDDIIKTAGHMVGPFEVESVLNEHAAVAESAVVGKPDPMIGQAVKAFVCLHTGSKPGDDLRFELLGYARKRLGTAAAPREIEFLDELPKNDAGKILRKILKERETAGVSRAYFRDS
jgi:acetyl-CoA synthetase